MTGGLCIDFIYFYSLKEIEQSINDLWYYQGAKRWKECQKEKGCLFTVNLKIKTFILIKKRAKVNLSEAQSFCNTDLTVSNL